MPPARYFLLRLTRDGPLVPARLRWIDHEPGEAENKLDRGRIVPFPIADIAGAEADPEIILDRIGVRRPRGDAGIMAHEARAALADVASLVPRPLTHWAHAQPITEAEYTFQFRRMRWAENNRPDDPVLKPRGRVDPMQMPLPNFDRENAL